MIAIATAAVALAGAAVAGLALAGRDDPAAPPTQAATSAAAPAPPPLPLDADAVAFVDPAGRRVLGQSPIEGVGDLVVGAGAVWALLDQQSQLVRFDPRSGKQGKPIDLPFPPAGVAATDAGVWVTETGGPGLARVDAATGKIAARLSVTERAGQGAPAGSEISDGAIGAIAAGARIAVARPRRLRPAGRPRFRRGPRALRHANRRRSRGRRRRRRVGGVERRRPPRSRSTRPPTRSWRDRSCTAS